MNKDNAHLYLPLVQALADGKQLQFRPSGEMVGSITYPKGVWTDTPYLYPNYSPDCFRIKPEPFEGEVWVHARAPNHVYSDSSCGSSAKSMLEAGYRKIKVREIEG